MSEIEKLAKEIEAAWDVEPTPFNRARVAARVAIAYAESNLPVAVENIREGFRISIKKGEAREDDA